MKNIKKFLLPLFCVICLVMSLALVSCGACEHVWGEWTDVEGNACGGLTQERVCSECGDKETQSVGGEHSYGAWTVVTPATCTEKGTEERVCSVCQDKETKDVEAKGHTEGALLCENCLTMLYYAPEIDYTAWDSFGIKVTDFAVTILDEDDPTNEGVMSLDFAEMYVTLDDNGEPYGYGKAKLKVDSVNLTTPLQTVFEANVYIDGGFLYVSAEGNEPAPYKNETIDQYIKIEFEKVPQLAKIFETLEYLEQEENQETINAFAEAFPKWLTEDFLPIFAETTLPAVDPARVSAVAKFINGFYKIEKSGDLTTISFNYDKVKEWNATLSTKTIAEFIDLLAGEGVTAKLETILTSDDLYNYSVADLINHIQVEEKIDIVKLLDAADKLLVILTEDETATLEKMLAAYMGQELPDLSTFLTNEDLLKMSVKDAAYMQFGDESVTPDEVVAQLKQMIAQYFDMVETMNLYETICPKYSVEEGSEPIEIDYAAELKATIDEYVDEIAAMATVVTSFDSAKKFVNAVITAKLPIGSDGPSGMMLADYTVTITAEKIEMAISYDDGENAAADVKVEYIPGYKVTVNADQLAKIKAELAKAPAITATIIEEFALSDEWDTPWAVYADEANKLVYIITIGNISKTNATAPAGTNAWEAYFYVTVVDYSNPFSVNVAKGCKNAISATYAFTSFDGKATISFYADTYYTYGNEALASCIKQDIINLIIKTMPDDLDEEIYTIGMLYDTVEKEVLEYDEHGHIYEYGHDFEEVEAARVEAQGCLGIGKYTYKCTECGKEYIEYYTNGHEVEWQYAVGANGTATVTLVCVTEGCDYVPDVTRTITIDSDVATSASTTVMYGRDAVAYTFTPNADGTYIFYGISAEGGYIEYERNLYKAENDSTVNNNYTYVEDSVFSFKADLEGGVTYKFVFMYGYSYDESYAERYSGDINLYIELAPEN